MSPSSLGWSMWTFMSGWLSLVEIHTSFSWLLWFSYQPWQLIYFCTCFIINISNFKMRYKCDFGNVNAWLTENILFTVFYIFNINVGENRKGNKEWTIHKTLSTLGTQDTRVPPENKLGVKPCACKGKAVPVSYKTLVTLLV